MRPQSLLTPDVLWFGTISFPLSFSLCFFFTVRGKLGCAETQQQGGDRGCHAQNPGEWPLCVTLESSFIAACPFGQS